MKKNSISKKILSLRKSAGWSQSELSRRTGIASACISQIENQKYTPSTQVCLKIAKVFKIPIGEIIREKKFTARKSKKDVKNK